MFYTINEKQYLDLVDFSKAVYRKDVIKNSNIMSPYFDFDLKRSRISYAYQKNKNSLESHEEKELFKLNLLFNDNKLFSSIFLESCSRFLDETDIKNIKLLFILRNHYLQGAWDELVNYITKSYIVNKKTAVQKIAEILSYTDIYYKQPEIKDKTVKSLSSR